MDKREEKALREQLATYKTEFAKLLYEHQKGLFERGESHYDPDKDRKAPSRFEGVLCQGGRSNRRERQLQKAMGQMVDPAEWIPPENENAGRDALGRFRKGHTGNPLGRPPSLKYKKAEPSIFLNTLVDMKIDGKIQQVPRDEALMTRLFADAMNGRAWAQRALLGIMDKHQENIGTMQLLAQEIADHYNDPDAPPMSEKDIRLARHIMMAKTHGRHPQLRRENMDFKRSMRRQRKKERDAAAAARRPRRRKAPPTPE